MNSFVLGFALNHNLAFIFVVDHLQELIPIILLLLLFDVFAESLSCSVKIFKVVTFQEFGGLDGIMSWIHKLVLETDYLFAEDRRVLKQTVQVVFQLRKFHFFTIHNLTEKFKTH